MRDSQKTKGQLIQELEGLRARVAQMEMSQAGDRKSVEARRGSEKKSSAIFSAEQKQVEHELKRQHDELQLILDSVPAYIYYKDKDGRIINMNKATASLTKVPKEKLLQRTVFQLMPDSADRYHKDDMEVITSGKPKTNIEEPLELPDMKRWLKTDKLPIKDEDGNVTGLIGFSVDITERKMAEEALRNSEEKLRLMFESMTDAVVLTDLNGIVVDVNEAALKTFGYSKEEAIGLNGLDIIAVEDRERAVRNIASSAAGPEIIGVQEYDILTKGGQRRSAEISVNRLSDVAGKPYGFITVIRDVTEKKRVEKALKESEKRYSSIFNNPLNMVFIHDENGVFVDANKAALSRLGYTQSDLGHVSFKEVAHPDDIAKAFEALVKVVEKGFMDERIELRLVSRSGEVIWVEVYEFPIEISEGKYRGMGISVDITERRKAEEALRQSEERYRLIAENMSDVIWIMDLNLRYQYVSPSIEHTRGFTVDEAMGMMARDYISEESLKIVTKRLADELELEKIGGADPDRVTTMELEVKKKDGSWIWIEVRVTFLRDNEGKPIGFLGVSRDITGRKRAQEALKDSEEKLRIIFDSMGDAATVVDLHDNIINCNEAAVRLHGFGSKNELIGRKASELVAVADRERAVKDAIGALKEPYVSGRAEYKLLTKDGREFQGEFGISVLKDKSGKPAGFIGLAHDISERKRAAEALRQSEEKLRLMFDSMTDGVVVTDMQLNIVDVNEASLRFSGYSRDELIGRNGLVLLQENDRDRSADIVNAIVQAKRAQEKHEHTYVRTDDVKSDIEVTTSVLRDSSENPVGLVNVVRDVTERKRMEEALRKSEEKYRDLVEKERDVIFSVDALGFITSINPAVKGWGFTPEEILGKNFIELVPEDWREKTAVELQNALLALGELTAETRVIHKSGEVLPIEYSAVVIKEEGKYAGVQGIVRDISGRKKAEEALRQSEEKFRVMFESISDGISVIDLKTGKIVDSNPAALHMFGLSKEEAVGQDALNFIAESDRVKVAEDMQTTLAKGCSATAEWCLLDKGGKEFDCEATAAVINDSSGSPVFMVNVMRDVTERRRIEKELDDYRNNLEKMVQERTSELIKANKDLKHEVTERKEAEEALRASEEKYRFLTEKVNDVVWTTDLNFRATYVSPSVSKILGFTSEERLTQAAQSIMTPESLQNAAKILADELVREEKEGLDPNRSITLDVEYYHKDGSTVWMESVVSGIRDNRGKVIGLHGVSRDITERRKSEQALRESERKYRQLVELAQEGIWAIDTTGNTMYVNPRMAEMLGYTMDEMLGRHLFSFMDEKEVPVAREKMERRRHGITERHDFEFLRKDGERVYTRLETSPILGEDGKYAGALAVVADVTESRRIENALKMSEEKLRGIFNSIHDAVVLTDLEFTILDVNDASLEMSGCKTKEELIGIKGYDLIAPEDFARAMATQPEAVEGRPVPRAEYKIINKLGREICADVGVSMYHDPSGKTAGFVTVLKDITEHRRMEDALRDSEEKLRIMFSSMVDGVVVTDLEGKITDLNEAQLRMFGYKEKKEIIGKGGFDYIVERDRDRAFKEMLKVFEEGYNIGATYGVVNNEGKEFESELSTALLHNAVGKPAGLITVMRDVTERRRMEQALRDSEEKLRIIFESIGDGVIVTDLEGIITETNEAAARLGGWPDKSKLIGMSGFDFVAESERGKMVADMIRALQEQRSINVEYSVKDKDGREYKSEVNVTLLRDASGSPKGIVSVIRDITERKRMEQDLRDSEEMSRGMLESTATAVCIVKDGEFQYVSPMFAEMTGYTVDELIGTVSTSYIHEDDRDSVMREAVSNLKGESAAPHEYRLLRKDGSFIWILEKIASIQYKGERAAIGSLLDITRLKRVEEALRDSEEKLRLIFASIPDGVTMTDLNGMIIEENDAGIRLSGFTSKDQVIGLNGFDFIASSDRSRALADLPKIFETGVRGPLEYRMVSNDGREYDGEIIAAMIRDKSGNPQGFITVIRDVTERKKAREELQELQEMTRGMLESAATGIYLVQDGKFEYVNPLFSGISGYAPEDLLGSDSMNYIHPDDREVARIKVIENLKGINDLPHEFRFMRKDGQSIWILERVASIEYKGRRAAIGSFMDISERKRIEEVLRQRSHELEQRTNQLLALQKITASIQSTLDLKEILQQVANGVVYNLGFDHAFIIKVDEAANVARGMVFATRDDASKVSDLQATIGKRLTEIEIPQVRGYSKVVDNSLDGKATITHDFFEVASAILTQDESNAAAELLDAKTVIVMPLFARDRHVGSILALTKQEEIGILLEPLRILSDQAGFAIENADLYRGVSEFAQRLSVISALSKILGSSLDIKGVYNVFTEEIKKVMDFDRTSIAMVEGDQLRYFVVAEEVDTALKDGAKLPLSDSATGLVVKTKKTIIEPDFDKEMKFPIDHMYYRSGLRSAIRVPLFSKGEVFATFNLASRRPNAYGEREKEILEQVSGSLTAAIENSRLFDQVKQHEDELLKAYEDLKSAQEYMVQAEKLRALGEMAGGVAHDFNNILAVVLGRTQLALEDVKDEKLKKDLQVIEQTAIDAATTVRRLQDFARVRVERNFEVLDLREVVESALQMAESRRVKLKEREGIDIDVESKLRDIATVEGDAAELREGLLNIIFNAMDAMPKGGKITIEAKRTKKWVTITISDTGIGIPEEIRSKIFEPFFTTRAHKGTGLGLSVTYGIIQRHRGEILVESTVGVGSTFYIKLPICESVISKKHAAGKADAVRSVSILMVDDNPEVAGILGLTLRRLGHKVVEANSGEAAINTFELSNFDLVITDLGMPDMSGYEVAKIVKEIKPGTPVLIISGWGGQLDLDEMPEVDGVIAKPFSKEILSEKIAALLSRKGIQAKNVQKKATKAKRVSKNVSKSDKAAEGLTGKEKPKKKKGTKPEV